MNLRCRKPRPLVREESTLRDARLMVIATEDTHAPERYFSIFRNPRIQVHVLPTQDGLSAPDHVLQRLDNFRKEHDLEEDDELWLMLDTDHWVESNHIANFNRVCIEATQKGFNLAHSNPCFEIWLLLHFTDLNPDEQFKRCGEVVQRLKEILGEYGKQTIGSERFSLDRVAAAVNRAETLDNDPGTIGRWPQENGTHVYQIVKKLLASGQ